jgi:uncharacterized protein
MVAGVEDSPVRQRLQSALREALKARDTIAISALRSALAAIDNAAAVPTDSAPAARTAGPAGAARTASPHFAGAVPGLRTGEAERRSLAEADIEEIVRTEVSEREAAIQDYDQAGHADQAGRLRREAHILMSVIDAGPQSSR